MGEGCGEGWHEHGGGEKGGMSMGLRITHPKGLVFK